MLRFIKIIAVLLVLPVSVKADPQTQQMQPL